MNNIRLLPVVIVAITALLVLKTIGMVANGGYVLTGVATAEAAGAPASTSQSSGETITLPAEPTLEDTSPTIRDLTPTISQTAAGSGDHSVEASAAATSPVAAPPQSAAGHSVPGEDSGNTVVANNACAPRLIESGDAASNGEGELTVVPGDCPPLVDALPQLLTTNGPVPLTTGDASLTENAVLERLASRRSELETYEQQLAMRALVVEAAEKRIDERQATLKSIEDQIGALVEQRKQMEEGQFAGIVAMYEAMKPKDAAKIFDNLDVDVLLRVAKMMSPRRLSPILAEMTTSRAQELTVRMATATTDPLDTMTPDDLAALPQIVGR